MKYSSVAGTSNNGAYEQGVIAGGSMGAIFGTNSLDAGATTASAAQQQQQQSSVIKTAPRAINSNNLPIPPQMHLDFSPKQEPIDLAPLSSNGTHLCLQDLGKISMGTASQLEHYYSSMNNALSNSSATAAKNVYSSVGPYYEYSGSATTSYHHLTQSEPSASTSTLLQPNTATAIVALGGDGVQQQLAQHQDWPYMSYNMPQHQHHHHHQQQQQQLGYLNQMDNCNLQLGGLVEHQNRTLYKNGAGLNGVVGLDSIGTGLLSPVDSGIGQELLLEQAKQQLHEFFGPVTLSTANMFVPSQSTAGAGHSSSVIHQHHDIELGFSRSIKGEKHQQSQREHSGSVESSHLDQLSNHTQQHQLHESREQSIPIVIPKLNNLLGFQYTLEAPISTSIRKEDDRMTYVNKGQFYTISFDYLTDPSCPLKGRLVRSQVIVTFREDKSYDDELRTWLVWYKRQHSPRQRIIEVDAKNSLGVEGGHFEELAHNALQFRWNPVAQSGPKVSIAVQCLSTDFSTQKGVKGLPLHIQIDTYDDQAESKFPFHRGYCQIKVFCDKGAERKLRDEDKRKNLQRQKNNAGSGGSNRKKMDGDFHETCERSPFYHAADLERPAALFVPTDDFFDTASVGSYDALSELEPQIKRPKTSERIMIYVRKMDEDVFTPLHLVPPTTRGLACAISEKYHLDGSKIEAFYKRCQKGGVVVKIDDEMLRHYSNQDTFLLELKQSELDRHIFYTVTLVELLSANNTNGSNYSGAGLGPTTTTTPHHPHSSHNNHRSQTPSATSSSSTTSEPPSASSTARAVEAPNNGQQQRITTMW